LGLAPGRLLELVLQQRLLRLLLFVPDLEMC
jgi:hypothetical protein